MVQNHPTAHGQEAVTQPVETRRRRRTTEIISHGTVTVGHGPAEPPKGAGEFTRMFAEPSPASPAAPQAPAYAAPPAQPPPQPPAGSEGQGEFTRMFNSPPQQQPPQAPPQQAPQTGFPQQQAPPQQTARDREMAEFERLFGPAGGRPFPGDEPPPKPRATESSLPPWPQTPPQQSPHQPPPQPAAYRQSTQQPVYPAQQPPAHDRPGEFTQFFGSGFTAEPVDVEREQQRAASEPSAPPRRPFQQASEFTRMFGPGAQGGFGEPAPPPPAQGPADWGDQGGAFTMFGTRTGAQGGPPPMAEMTQHAGPSEYTRMISGGGSSVPGAGLNQDSPALKSGAMPALKQQPGQQPGPPPSRAGMIGIALAIGGIVIALIVALVLLLTSK